MNTPLGKLLLAAGLLFSGAAMSQTTLRVWNTHPEGYPVTEALQYFADAAQQSTQDRVQIKIFSNGVLGDQPKAVKMMKAGELDLAEFNIAPLAEAVPAVKVLTRPFLFRDSKHMFQHIDGPLGTHIESQLKDAGFVVLGWYDGGARSFYCVNKPIHSVQDLSGQRIRVQQSEAAIEMVKLLGGTPVVLPYKEVGDALKDDKIDCAENNLPSYESTGHMKFAKYVYLTYHTVAPEALVMSLAAWDKLSKEDQVRMLEAGRSSALRMRELWNKRIETSRLAATKQGSQFATLRDAGSVVRRLTPMFTKYLKDPESRSEVFTILAN
jgi:tripartite ATP-independent transporter DctP family solute receptor